eukprot:1784236-Pleurochrysis_carterae.AAC.1
MTGQRWKATAHRSSCTLMRARTRARARARACVSACVRVCTCACAILAASPTELDEHVARVEHAEVRPRERCVSM